LGVEGEGENSGAGAGDASVERGFQIRIEGHRSYEAPFRKTQSAAWYALRSGADPCRIDRLPFRQAGPPVSLPQSGHIVKGDISRGEVYYTQLFLSEQCGGAQPDRTRATGGPLPSSHRGWSVDPYLVGEARPSRSSLANFVMRPFTKLRMTRSLFLPEFTTCNACNRTSRGLQNSCAYCGSQDVDGITRITVLHQGSSWNKGKLGELRNRYPEPSLL